MERDVSRLGRQSGERGERAKGWERGDGEGRKQVGPPKKWRERGWTADKCNSLSRQMRGSEVCERFVGEGHLQLGLPEEKRE